MNSYFLNQTSSLCSLAGEATIAQKMIDTGIGRSTTDPISDWLMILI